MPSVLPIFNFYVEFSAEVCIFWKMQPSRPMSLEGPIYSYAKEEKSREKRDAGSEYCHVATGGLTLSEGAGGGGQT
jgi:hypothetical protein